MKISILAFLTLCALLLSQFQVSGKDPFPKDWRPGLDLVAHSIANDLEKASAQQEMNLLSGLLAEAKDAELAIVYLRLYVELSKTRRARLKAEQTAWLKKREHAVEETTPKDGTRGSIAPLEENERAIEMTEKRIKELKERLEKQS